MPRNCRLLTVGEMANSFKCGKSRHNYCLGFLSCICMVFVMAYMSDNVRQLLTIQASLFSVVVVPPPQPLKNNYWAEQSWIDCMTDGHWVPDTDVYSNHLEGRLNTFFRKVRDFYHMPTPLQRKDKKCGSMSFGVGEAGRFRAVCDPFQSTPCCFKGTCTNISIQECTCPNCFDLRPTLHGELSKWVGHRSSCPIKNFTSNEACEILHGKTLLFIGDSFMKYMFMGFQILLRNNDETSCVKNVPKYKRAHCKWMYMFTKECRLYIPTKDALCNGTVHLHRLYITTESANITPAINKHDIPNTIIIVGVGLYYHFNTQNIIKQVALPIFEALEDIGSDLHPVFWMLPHSLGILKTPTIPGQSNPKLLQFNKEMRKFLSDRGVIMVDAFNLTRNLASYDGAHFPKASNVLKADVLLNHIEHKRSGLKSSEQNQPLT